MIYLNQLGIVCPLGNSGEQVKQRLLNTGQSGVSLSEEYSPGRLLPVGRIDAELPLPAVSHLDVIARSRNNQVALAALAQIRTAVDNAIGSLLHQERTSAGAIPLWSAGTGFSGYSARGRA